MKLTRLSLIIGILIVCSIQINAIEPITISCPSISGLVSGDGLGGQGLQNIPPRYVESFGRTNNLHVC